MVLNHVAQRARFLVITHAAFHANKFGRRNLHVVYIATVPQRLENTIAEAERQNVLNRFLAQVMVDAVHLRLIKHRVEVSSS